MNPVRTTSVRAPRPLVAGVAMAAIAAVTTLAGPANAAERTVSDPDDITHGVDVRQVRVVNDDVVRIVTHHDDLLPHADSAGLTVFLDTDPAKAGPEFAFSTGLTDGTDLALVRAGWSGQGERVAGKRCTYRSRIDYAADVSRIRIARACLGSPGKVRVAVRATGVTRHQVQRDWLTARRTFTGWVARG